jgi:hypothetical protein
MISLTTWAGYRGRVRSSLNRELAEAIKLRTQRAREYAEAGTEGELSETRLLDAETWVELVEALINREEWRADVLARHRQALAGRITDLEIQRAAESWVDKGLRRILAAP